MKFSRSFQFLLCLLCLVFSNCSKAQYITVDNKTYTDQQLVEKFIGAKNSSCVTISGVKVSGGNLGSNDSSYGYFSNGSLLGMDEGIILSTGSVLAAPGPKSRNVQSVTASGWIGDQDLADAIGKPISEFANATILEFDFTSSLSNKVSFRYKFLSEEYHPGNYSYSDAFAFLIKKAGSTDPYTNIALIPGTNEPVSTTTINDITNEKYFEGFIGFDSRTDSTIISPSNFNGQTKVLTAIADIVAGTQYHIKLVIADQGKNANSQYDSAVFLEAGSFTGNIDLLPNIETDDSAIICNGVPVRLQPKDPRDINDLFAKYTWTEAASPNIVLSTDSFYDTNTPGDYRLKVDLSSGCTLAGNVKLEDAPLAQVNQSAIMICDDDFDLKYKEKLAKYNNQIVTNYSRDFTVSYYTSSGVLIPDPNSEFEFTQNPQTLIVKVSALSCMPISYPIQFYHGSQLTMNYPQTQTSPPVFDVCDNELKNSKTVDLSDYVKAMTNENPDSVTFYTKESEAQKGGSSTVSTVVDMSPKNANKVFFIRIKQGNFCDNYSSFRLVFKQPKKSTILKDTLVCKGSLTDLDAGTGLDVITGLKFTSYKWSNGKTSQKIEKVPAGDYWVELGFNGCVYRQDVKVSEPADLVINNALIEGNRVTVLAANGIPPYQYKLDNGSFQLSNVFDNVPKGDHTIEVIDACGSVHRDFSLINIKNVITPNDDGINDFIDYSDLMTKLEPRFEVYDRNGIAVFKGTLENKFIWNGKLHDRSLPTSSYWYILEWNESGNPKRVQNTGWILLKNRN